MSVAVGATVQTGLNGLHFFHGRLAGRSAVEIPLAPGTPSLVAAVLAWPAEPVPLRLALVDPQGRQVTKQHDGSTVVLHHGAPGCFVVTDPEEGTWTLRVDSAEPSDALLEVAAVAAAQDEARDSLLAAAASVPDEATHSLPRGVLPLLAPVCVALEGLAGRPPQDPPPAAVVAAADITGADPDAIQDALADLPDASMRRDIAAALASTAGM